MPAYTPPTWVNDSGTPIDADHLTELSQAVAGALQVDGSVVPNPVQQAALRSLLGVNGSGLSVVDNANGTLTITATGTAAVVDNGDGTLTITT